MTKFDNLLSFNKDVIDFSATHIDSYCPSTELTTFIIGLTHKLRTGLLKTEKSKFLSVTLPILQRPGICETNELGEVFGLNGIHVVDGAALPALSEKSRTLQ